MPSDKTWLYIIRAGDYFKVGVSKDPERRLKDIQPHCPLFCELWFAESYQTGKEARRVESACHRFLKKERQHGEWFILSHETIRGLLSKLGVYGELLSEAIEKAESGKLTISE